MANTYPQSDFNLALPIGRDLTDPANPKLVFALSELHSLNLSDYQVEYTTEDAPDQPRIIELTDLSTELQTKIQNPEVALNYDSSKFAEIPALDQQGNPLLNPDGSAVQQLTILDGYVDGRADARIAAAGGTPGDGGGGTPDPQPDPTALNLIAGSSTPGTALSFAGNGNTVVAGPDGAADSAVLVTFGQAPTEIGTGGVNVGNGQPITTSCLVKAGTLAKVHMASLNNSFGVIFDLTAGTATVSGNPGATAGIADASSRGAKYAGYQEIFFSYPADYEIQHFTIGVTADTGSGTVTISQIMFNKGAHSPYNPNS